ncbi:MAG: Zn-ribbon domain-containing OB-fold protein [Mycobacteriales bacterium]
MPTRTAVPAVQGWFTMDRAAPALLGSRCAGCATYAFPPAATRCANPRCDSEKFDQVRLSTRGRIWSYTDARYQPPPPYLPVTDPYEPFSIAAVELEVEQLVVMGQVVADIGVAELSVGMSVELVLDTLFSDDDHDYLVWKWRPVSPAAPEERP